MIENEISYIIRGCIFKVYNELGPGLLESAYESALEYELLQTGLEVKRQLRLPIIYKEIKIDNGFIIDLLVQNCVIIEPKSVVSVEKVHFKQLITYLKLSDKKLGLLVNFNCDSIDKNIFQKVNSLDDSFGLQSA